MERNKGERRGIVVRAGVSPVESNKKIGPIRSHLYAYAFAKAEARKGRDAQIIFRVDDTDGEKHTKEAGRAIYAFFAETLGLNFDVTPENAREKIGQSVFQSERGEFYGRALEELFDKRVAFIEKESGLALFDIERFGEVYGDTLQIEDLKLGEIKRSIEVLIRGGTRFFPLMRSDRTALYHLASVVDDGEFGITHIVRGQDKISILEFQEMVRIALGLQPKKYLHTPLMLDEKGGLLGGAVKFGDFLERGFLPHALISYMISSGYGDVAAIYPSLDSFIEQFDAKKIHKNNGKFDLTRLKDVNRRMMKEVSRETFGISFSLFLKARREEEILNIFEEDEALQRAIFEIRRDFEDALLWTKRVIKPEYMEVFEEDFHACEAIFAALSFEEIPDAEKLGLSKKEMFNALRWIVGGTKEMLNVETAFAYLKERGLLEKRINAAKNALRNMKR